MVLDTSFCVALFRERAGGRAGAATAWLANHAAEPVLVPVFVLCELSAGAELSARRERETARVERFAALVETVNPGPEFAGLYGRVEAHLRRNGQAIPVMDLLIGVSALQAGARLVTHDSRHFHRIPGLEVVVLER